MHQRWFPQIIFSIWYVLWGHVYIYMYLVLIFGNVITQPCFPTLFSTCQIWHTPSLIKKETRKIIKLQNLIMICWYLLKYVKEHTHISCKSLSYLFLQHTDHCFVFLKMKNQLKCSKQVNMYCNYQTPTIQCTCTIHCRGLYQWCMPACHFNR